MLLDGKSAARHFIYRDEIDGLRAVAVLLVVAFHAFPNDIRGGFIGVDVFFVVSGFLITGIIIDALDAGDFSFVDFYVRRTRRIFPALALVLLASAAAGHVLLLPWDFAALGREILAGALFVENWLLLGEAGYFDRASELKPLLHLWSLGIEEQFYLVWPLAVVVAFRKRASLIAMAAALFAVSLAWNLLLVQSWQTGAFYLPFTRFWELMAGALLATAGRRSFEFDARFREGLALGGISLILASAVLLTERSLFRGYWALAPVVGTSMLIVSGGTTTVAKYVLRHPWMVRIGLISYPFYLWHWPILAFARNVEFKEPTSLEKIGSIACALLLALLTYRCLEFPLRRFRPRMQIAAGFASLLIVIGFLGWQIVDRGGFPGRFPPSVQTLSRNFSFEAHHAIRFGSCLLGESVSRFPEFCDGEASERERLKVALWGDSHAASLYPGLENALHDRRDVQLAQFTVSGCPPLFDFDSARRRCSEIAEAVSSGSRKCVPTRSSSRRGGSCMTIVTAGAASIRRRWRRRSQSCGISASRKLCSQANCRCGPRPCRKLLRVFRCRENLRSETAAFSRRERFRRTTLLRKARELGGRHSSRLSRFCVTTADVSSLSRTARESRSPSTRDI